MSLFTSVVPERGLTSHPCLDTLSKDLSTTRTGQFPGGGRESTREGLGEMESERDFPKVWPSCGTFLWRTHAGRRVVFPQHLLCTELSHLILNTPLGDRYRLSSPPNALDYKLHEGKEFTLFTALFPASRTVSHCSINIC